MNYKHELLDVNSVKDFNSKFETIRLNYSRSIKNIDYELYYAVIDIYPYVQLKKEINNVFDNLIKLTERLTYE